MEPALEFILEIIKTFLYNYPDSFRRAFVVNGTKLSDISCGVTFFNFKII